MAPAVSIITPVKAKNDPQVQWLDEAIATVQGQTSDDWEMIIVDDHSPKHEGICTLAEKWGSDKITFFTAEDAGASASRNYAATEAKADLLLPLDADDKLSVNAVESFLKAWETKGDARIIFSDIMMFGRDFARTYLAPGYDFRTLLQATFMTVGCLHTKADWEKVGGWRQDMELGLEDWEYWIALGEIGACGKRVQEPLYWYRRHAHGRLAHLKQNTDLWQKAYQRMRELHRDTYNGRVPMGCCGGAAVQVGTQGRKAAARQQLPLRSNLEAVVYTGRRKGGFWVMGNVTRVRYHVPGQGMLLEDGNGRPGVDGRDVPMLRAMQQGKSFRVIQPPKAAAPPPKPVLQPARPITSPAWDEGVMESPESVPRAKQRFRGTAEAVKTMTLRELKAVEIRADTAQTLLHVEMSRKKPRKTVIAYLRKVANA